jgi:hypothetical protein
MKIHADKIIIESSNFSRFTNGVRTTCTLFTSLKIEGFMNCSSLNETEFKDVEMGDMVNNLPINNTPSHECLTLNKRI